MGISALVLLVFVLLDAAIYPSTHQPRGLSFNEGENGLWLRYTWYFGQRRPGEWSSTVDRLRIAGVRYAFFHVRSIRRDGSLAFHFAALARQLNAEVARQTPEIKRIAWIYAGNAQGHGDVDLSKQKVRSRMASEAAWLVRDAGFDGIQWDYEACPDGDQDFLKLLDETRAALPPRSLIGTAVPIWMPAPLTWLGWSDGYFSEVARHCDQMAVMCYDTGAFLPRSYVWLVSQQVIHVTRAVAAANPSCRVLFGLPTYESGAWSHTSYSENLALGLRGIEDGLKSGRASRSVFAGVAPFADYTTDEGEWRLLEQKWPLSRP